MKVVAGEQVGFSELEAAIGRFEAKLSSDVVEDGTGSIAAGVFDGDKVVWAKGFGWADVDKQIPAEADTIYRIGSISKSFTAVLMAQMAE
ncbi:MAG: beta-lactamase family protein [Planctomycetes bacterium]|nr:beta-lactamase family protein [Planctomycetota bacterium]